MSIGKRLIIIFLSSFFGIIGVPDFLVAADSVEIQDVSYSFEYAKKVETPVKPAVATTKTTVKPTPATTTTTTPAPVVAPAPVKPAVKPNSINIAGRTISVTTGIRDTSIDAGDHANLYYNGKFLYGHNSASVFGGLKNLGIGSTFTMTLDGVTKTYRIDNKVIYDYDFTSTG